MRHPILSLSLLSLCLCAGPALAAQPLAAAKNAPGQKAPAMVQEGEVASDAEVLEYIRLFGYREMLELGAERQLASLMELTRLTRPGLAPGVLELIHDELRVELKAATQESVAEMVAVFKRHLGKQDISYLNSIGRDPRMQRVVRLQPVISGDMEEIGERLAERVTAKAAPRIEERLKKLQGGQEG